MRVAPRAGVRASKAWRGNATTFEGRARNRALSLYNAVGAGGFTLGMVAGGLMTSVSWRWVFFAPALIGAALLVAGHRFIRADGQLPPPTVTASTSPEP